MPPFGDGGLQQLAEVHRLSPLLFHPGVQGRKLAHSFYRFYDAPGL